MLTGSEPPPPPRLHEELFMSLERDQMVAGRHQALGRAHLSLRARAALWVLRGFVMVVGALVIYTFLARI